MSQEGDADGPELLGLPLSDAVDAVVDAGDGRDPETVRETLATVAEDGVVTEDGVEAALGRASKVVATPETRVELAADALDSARAAADHVSDLGAVRSRLDGFEARLDAAEDRVAALGDDLQALVERAGEPGGTYAVAAGIRRLTEAANAVQRAADDLSGDLEAFERWVGDQDRRVRQFRGDLDALADYREELADAAERLEAVDGDGGDGSDFDPAVAWVDATLRHRVLGLLLADLRAEFDDLRTWADREGLDDDWAADVGDRLDRLDDRGAATGDRLAELARPAWRDRFGDRIAAFEDALDDFAPPVAWRDVQATLDEHRPGDGDAA